MFYIKSILLGVGLAMDAFSVSIANCLTEPGMSRGKRTGMAFVYAVFQFAMPMIGWICVHTVVNIFTKLEVALPWIALVLLLYIGGKMIYEGVREKNRGAVDGASLVDVGTAIGLGTILVQGIATSIDALSVGFTIAEYGLTQALICCLIIAVVTWIICMIGSMIGSKIGLRFSSSAQIVGGLILVGIGLEIWVRGVFL